MSSAVAPAAVQHRAIAHRRSGAGVIGTFALALVIPAVLIAVCVWIAGERFQTRDAVNAVVPFLCMTALYGIVLASSPTTRQMKLGRWLFLLFLVRAVLAAQWHEWFWTRDSPLFQAGVSLYDAFRYDESARQVAAYGWSGAVISMPYYGPIALFAGLYWLFGYNPLFAVLANTLLGALTSVVIVAIAKPFGPRVIRWSALIAIMIPSSIVYGAQTMKETLIMFLFCWGVYYIGRLIERARVFDVAVFAGILGVLVETRVVYAGALIASAAVVYALKLRLTFRQVAVGVAAIALVSVVANSAFSRAAAGNVLSVEFWWNKWEETRRSAELQAADWQNPQASLGLRTAVDLRSPATYVFIPVRFATLYLVPPFWKWGVAPDLTPYEEIGALMSWACVPAVLWGLAWSVRRGQVTHVLTAFLITTLLVSIGTAFVDARYKVPLLPLYFLLAAIGLVDYRRWRRFYWMYVVLVIMMAVTYTGLKSILAG